MAIRWLQPLLLQWRAAHPGASVRLVGTDEEAGLRDEQIDFRRTKELRIELHVRWIGEYQVCQ